MSLLLFMGVDMITAEQVQKTVKKLKITHWSPRACAICNTPLFYVFDNEKAFFDSNCDCVNNCSHPVERTYDDVTRLFNMQPTEETKNMMWESFKTDSIKGGN